MDGMDSIDMQAAFTLQTLELPTPRATGEAAGRGKPVAGDASSEAGQKQVAKDFESVLLTKLFDQVQESIGGWDVDEEDGASKQVQGLFWLYLAQDVADKGGFGLWREIYQNLRHKTAPGAAGEQIDEGL